MNQAEISQTLNQLRDEDPVPIYFEPAINLLMDDSFCEAINSLINGTGFKWEKKAATPCLASQIPAERGIYMFVWRPKLAIKFANDLKEERFFWVIYVGKAGKPDSKNDTLRQRYHQEYRKHVGKNIKNLWSKQTPQNRSERLDRYLSLRPLEYWFLTIDEVENIETIEKKLIRILRPPLNVQFGPKLRAGKAVPAF